MKIQVQISWVGQSTSLYLNQDILWIGYKVHSARVFIGHSILTFVTKQEHKDTSAQKMHTCQLRGWVSWALVGFWLPWGFLNPFLVPLQETPVPLFEEITLPGPGSPCCTPVGDPCTSSCPARPCPPCPAKTISHPDQLLCTLQYFQKNTACSYSYDQLLTNWEVNANNPLS